MAERKTQGRTTSTSGSDPATAYAEAVVAGEIVAGPYVRAACQRHLSDLERTDLQWDVDALDSALDFFRHVLRLSGGQFEGDPFEPDGWQAFLIGSLFGWKKSGLRRFRTAYIETGKGSGKTPLAAGIGIRMLMDDDEPRSEVYASAYNQDQARVLFRVATVMVQLSPALSRRLDLTGGADPDNIAHMDSGSFFRPISSERQGRGKSGPIPHCAILDEIHEHPTNAMVEFLDAGKKHRRQPLMLMITNSGADRNTVCWDYHTHALKVAEQSVEDDSLFSYVCALDEGDDPFKDESCWVKSNPGLPRIPGYEYIRDQVSKSKGIPSKETICRRLNFCQWTDAANPWLATDIWQSAQHTLDLKEYEGFPCYGGLDLSLSSDLTAFCLAFEIAPRQWDLFSWFWMPGGRLLELQERDNMSPRYQQWRDGGYLNAPDGKTIDYDHAAELLAEVCARFDVRSIAYDRAKVELLRASLEKIGCDAPLVEHGQGFYKAKQTGLWMPASIEETEAGFIEERIRINENPVLSWNVSSAVTQSSTLEPSDRYFAKRKSSGRIDGAVAMVMSIGCAAGRVEAEPSVYEQRGVVTL